MAENKKRSRRGNRKRLEIMRDILLVAAEAGEDGSRKTHIMYRANLSYVLLKRYLSDALNADLVKKESLNYVITEKGNEFLTFYKDFVKKQVVIDKQTIYLNNGKKILEKLVVPEVI
jgi:predicted transcriptional regulator